MQLVGVRWDPSNLFIHLTKVAIVHARVTRAPFGHYKILVLWPVFVICCGFLLKEQIDEIGLLLFA